METVGEQRDEIAKHMARRREAMQQQELRRVRAACFAVEHIAIVDLGGPIMDGGHDAFPFAQKLGRASAFEGFADRLADDVDDGRGRGHERRVIDRM